MQNASYNFQQPALGQPLVSVVIPTCGRPALLYRCLSALRMQTLAPDRFEIIVVDDHQQCASWSFLNAWQPNARVPPIRCMPNLGPRGPAAARNQGWRAARAPIVAFTDDDTEPAIDWLANGLAAFAPGIDAVSGRIVMPLPAQPTDYERDASRLETADFVTANCFVRKSVLMQLDGFDERFRLAWREDSDLQFRLMQIGGTLRHASRATVVHPVRPARWGVSLLQQKKILFDALLFKKHPQLYRQRIGPTPRWDYHLIVLLFVLTIVALVLDWSVLAYVTGAAWVGATGWFFRRRMRGTAHTASHVAEMLLTSVLIPLLAVYWRLRGALRFRVVFL